MLALQCERSRGSASLRRGTRTMNRTRTREAPPCAAQLKCTSVASMSSTGPSGELNVMRHLVSFCTLTFHGLALCSVPPPARRCCGRASTSSTLRQIPPAASRGRCGSPPRRWSDTFSRPFSPESSWSGTFTQTRIRRTKRTGTRVNQPGQSNRHLDRFCC